MSPTFRRFALVIFLAIVLRRLRRSPALAAPTSRPPPPLALTSTHVFFSFSLSLSVYVSPPLYRANLNIRGVYPVSSAENVGKTSRYDDECCRRAWCACARLRRAFTWRIPCRQVSNPMAVYRGRPCKRPTDHLVLACSCVTSRAL